MTTKDVIEQFRLLAPEETIRVEECAFRSKTSPEASITYTISIFRIHKKSLFYSSDISMIDCFAKATLAWSNLKLLEQTTVK